eukprot:CAMPEP_0181454326 /NCGR_PEP_ID=MMETSP1110-20121109/30180_1 /TAXON_ID=174948 /ORGANISM="Symbiodinium sp., Strain CCMP421" /LENGTH=135 /DNA_ID=CAMNT_0023578667 /DNA_START=183 /DNA_END=591 /DNA_ORIENTATION=-
MQAMLWKMVEMDLELLAAHRRLGSLKIPRAPVASLLQLIALGRFTGQPPLSAAPNKRNAVVLAQLQGCHPETKALQRGRIACSLLQAPSKMNKSSVVFSLYTSRKENSARAEFCSGNCSYARAASVHNFALQALF